MAKCIIVDGTLEEVLAILKELQLTSNAQTITPTPTTQAPKVVAEPKAPKSAKVEVKPEKVSEVVVELPKAVEPTPVVETTNTSSISDAEFKALITANLSKLAKIKEFIAPLTSPYQYPDREKLVKFIKEN